MVRGCKDFEAEALIVAVQEFEHTVQKCFIISIGFHYMQYKNPIEVKKWRTVQRRYSIMAA
jgi:transposase